MSSSHLSCSSKLPVEHPLVWVAHARDMGITSKISVSLAPSCIPRPPSEGFLLCLLCIFLPISTTISRVYASLLSFLKHALPLLFLVF